MSRKKVILVILLSIFVASLYQNIKNDDVKRVEELKYKTGKREVAENSGDKDFPKINMALLSGERKTFRIGKKNIFEPLKYVKKKPPALPPPSPKPPVKVPPPEPEPELPVETPMEREVATFTFLGFLQKERTKTIFLSRGDEILIVKQGDTILNNYIVKGISDDNIVIASRDGSEILDVRLIENERLKNR